MRLLSSFCLLIVPFTFATFHALAEPTAADAEAIGTELTELTGPDEIAVISELQTKALHGDFGDCTKTMGFGSGLSNWSATLFQNRSLIQNSQHPRIDLNSAKGHLNDSSSFIVSSIASNGSSARSISMFNSYVSLDANESNLFSGQMALRAPSVPLVYFYEVKESSGKVHDLMISRQNDKDVIVSFEISGDQIVSVNAAARAIESAEFKPLVLALSMVHRSEAGLSADVKSQSRPYESPLDFVRCDNKALESNSRQSIISRAATADRPVAH